MLAWLQTTAARMEPPPLYGVFHLLWLFLGIPSAVLGAWLLRRLSPRGQRQLLLALWALLLLSEIYKQLFLTFIDGSGRYQFWYFPFQLCSMPLYLLPTAALLRPGKGKSACCVFLCGFSLLGGVFALLFPQDLMRPYLSLTLHGFIWHILLIFLGCWLGFSGLASQHLPKGALSGAGLLYLAAGAAALALNLSLWEVSGHGINMFYLGPMPSSQPVFEQLTEKIGWLGNLPFYMLCEMAGAFLFWLPFRLYAARKVPAAAR